MNRLRLLVVLLALGAGRPTSSAAQGVAGTYSVVVCKQAPCVVGDTTNVVVSGTLVFADSVIDVTGWPGSLGRPTMPFMRGPLNGCFDLTTHRLAELTYIGIGEVQRFTWSGSAEKVSAWLYRSPDAFAVADLSVHQDVLAGHSTSRGRINGPVEKQRDTIVGRRTGPAKPDLCRSAGERKAELEARDPFAARYIAGPPNRVDPARRYVILVADTVAPRLGFSAFTPTPLGFRFPQPGMTVINAPAEPLGDSAVARIQGIIESIVSRGGRADRITVVGVGAGLSTVHALSSVEPDVDYAFVGGCPARRARGSAGRTFVVVADDANAGCPVGTSVTTMKVAGSVRPFPQREDWQDRLLSWILDR